MFVKILVDIVILIAVSFFVLVIMQVRTNQQVSRLWQTLESTPTQQHFHVDMITLFPAPVQRYFLHAIALGTLLVTSIKLGGIFQAERTFEGITIPSRISAGWWFGTERYVESFVSEIEVL
ncbi:hypothetical protein [Nostoc flagelliforme]